MTMWSEKWAEVNNLMQGFRGLKKKKVKKGCFMRSIFFPDVHLRLMRKFDNTNSVTVFF